MAAPDVIVGANATVSLTWSGDEQLRIMGTFVARKTTAMMEYTYFAQGDTWIRRKPLASSWTATITGKANDYQNTIPDNVLLVGTFVDDPGGSWIGNCYLTSFEKSIVHLGECNVTIEVAGNGALTEAPLESATESW